MSAPFGNCLFVDLEGQRARYECLLPDCPHPREGPVFATDVIEGPDKKPARRGAAGVAQFIDRVKTDHLTTYHRREDT
ncbi:hypothetical protein [Streptomyces sp. NPDC057325]|uniref:hypothetical protein n=1 Tax=unclassified Streptomyces TaxID=2593676 RepID=UPI00362D29F6